MRNATITFIEELLRERRRFSAPVLGGKFLATNHLIAREQSRSFKAEIAPELPVQRPRTIRGLEGKMMMIQWEKIAFAALSIQSALFANLAYVANADDGTVSVIDTSNYSQVGLVTVGGTPYDIAITPDGAFAYVSNGGGYVSVIEIADNSIYAVVTVGNNPLGVAVTPNNQYVYVANGSSVSVSVIEVATNTNFATVALTISPVEAAVTPDGSFVYVSGSVGPSGIVTLIDTSDNSNPTGIPVNSQPTGIAMGSNGMAYVANSGADTVSIIDVVMQMQIGSITVGTLPYGVAITPDATILYVVNQGGPDVSVVDVMSSIAVQTVTVGGDPIEVAMTPDGAFAYVTNSSLNQVQVIRVSDHTIVATVSVGMNPIGIAITPNVAPNPPASISGTQFNDDFGLMYELYNVIFWSASSSNGIAGYSVYRNGTLIARLGPSTFEYKDHNQANVPTMYSVAAFDAEGNESSLQNIRID